MPIKLPKQIRTVWFVKNTSTEGPGYLGVLLKRWKINYQICDLQKGDSLPRVKRGDAVVVLGGPMSANDVHNHIPKLLLWTQALLKRKIRYLGICLGLQTLVKAAGGKVIQSPVKEVGLFRKKGMPFTCKVVSSAQQDDFLKGIPSRFSIFQLHGETVVLTKGMQLLAESVGCRNQIVKVQPSAYGLQGHLEMTGTLLRSWIKEDTDLRKLNSRALLLGWKKYERALQKNCEIVFANFLKIAAGVKP